MLIPTRLLTHTQTINEHRYYRETVLTLQQFERMLQPNTSVSDGIYDILRRLEGKALEQRAQNIERESLCERVFIVSIYETKELITACMKQRRPSSESLTKEGGFFDWIRERLGLSERLRELDLISFGVSHNEHFSEVIWLPETGTMFAFDSFAPCGHLVLIEKSILRFAEHCMLRFRNEHENIDEEEATPIMLVPKDESSSIERQSAQPSDSNVCAFSAALFLQRALTQFCNLIEADEDNLPVDTEKLYQSLQSMSVQQLHYTRKRRSATEEIRHLQAAYSKYRTENPLRPETSTSVPGNDAPSDSEFEEGLSPSQHRAAAQKKRRRVHESESEDESGDNDGARDRGEGEGEGEGEGRGEGEGEMRGRWARARARARARKKGE